MHFRTVAIAACLLMLACGGSAPTSPTPAPSPGPQPPASTFTLTGHVFASDTGVPLPGANIYILFGANRGGFAQSDERGIFTLSALQPGTFTIEVVPQQVYNVVQQDVVLTTDTALDFGLTPRVPRVFALSGRVTDVSTSAPLAGASITVLDGDSANRTATSDGSGTFTIPSVIFGGFTVRTRHDGYDSVFQAVRLVADTALDIQMRPAMQSLAGTWAGGVAYSSNGNGVTVPEATLTQSGSTVEGVLAGSAGRFTGTLQNPSLIGATTEITGTMTVFFSGGGGRNIISCQGTGSFAGTVNWTRLVITAPQVVFPCAAPYTNVTIALTRQQ